MSQWISAFFIYILGPKLYFLFCLSYAMFCFSDKVFVAIRVQKLHTNGWTLTRVILCDEVLSRLSVLRQDM